MARMTQRDRERLGIAIRDLREAHGWTANQIADTAGITRRYLNYIEDGSREAAAHILLRVLIAVIIGPASEREGEAVA
jgi:transcriptional regulator with XRE-family HTH domain